MCYSGEDALPIFIPRRSSNPPSPPPPRGGGGGGHSAGVNTGSGEALWIPKKHLLLSLYWGQCGFHLANE